MAFYWSYILPYIKLPIYQYRDAINIYCDSRHGLDYFPTQLDDRPTKGVNAVIRGKVKQNSDVSTVHLPKLGMINKRRDIFPKLGMINTRLVQLISFYGNEIIVIKVIVLYYTLCLKQRT